MSEVAFYYINGEDLLQVSTSFVSGLYKQNCKSVLFSNDDDFLKKFDMKIWTFSSEMFIPHVMKIDNIEAKNQSFFLINEIEKIDDFDIICLFFTNDNFESIKKSVLNAIEFGYKKIYCIFDGIDSVKKYADEIKSIDTKSSRFFVKNGEKWNQEDIP